MVKRLALIGIFLFSAHTMLDAGQYFCQLNQAVGWEVTINPETGSATFYDGENWFFMPLARNLVPSWGPVYLFENIGDSMRLLFDQILMTASLTIGNQNLVAAGSCIYIGPLLNFYPLLNSYSF